MRGLLVLAAALLPVSHSAAQDAYVRVVDVGNGLCVIARAPGGETLLYDAGHSGSFCPDAVRELIGSRPLDIIVLSHSDSDHISDGRAILRANGARLILHPGDTRSGQMLEDLREEIEAQDAAEAEVRTMVSNPPGFGDTFPLGEATVRFVAGWSDGAQTALPGDPPYRIRIGATR